MAGSYPGLTLQGGTFYVRVSVPADCRRALGQTELWESLKTGDPADARRAYPAVFRKFKARIADSRRGTVGTAAIREALLRWAAYEVAIPDNGHGGDLTTPFLTSASLDALLKASTDPEGWRAVPNFDSFLVGLLNVHGLRVSAEDPAIPPTRREAALMFFHAGLRAERNRLANAFSARADAIRTSSPDDVVRLSARPSKQPPQPSVTLQQLHDRWSADMPSAAKERGKYDHQIRRLIEFVGNKPANHLTPDEITEFFRLVARFPGRKRANDLSGMPIQQLVEEFEARNTKIPIEERLPVLSKVTVEGWFAGYSRAFEYGIATGLLDDNPFQRLKRYVVKGAESVRRRAFTQDEIKTIFSAPLFTGFDLGCGRFRDKVGSSIVKDSKYWLPILALHHGARLTEMAGMPVGDFKQWKGDGWYFDLTNRKLKTAESPRLVPLHPTLLTLGWPEHVQRLRDAGETWLFPDLDHKSRYGPGHEFSKWWGGWCDVHGLSDPSLTHHSWRHTWKRAARASAVKEEMHDVISGHKGATVGRSYGEGAEIAALARDMALIAFPGFPRLP